MGQVAVCWARARARGAGLSRPSQHTATCPIRDNATQKRWPWNREGGGARTGTRDVESSRPDGRAQQGRGARSDHKNTLPLGGRAEGHVQLYGERGRAVGGADRETGMQDSRDNSSVDEGMLSRATSTRRVERLMNIADCRNQEGSRASGRGMHLAVCPVMPADETTDSRHRRGPSPFAPPHTPTPKPSTTSRIGRGRGVQACIWDAGSGNQKRTLVGRSRRVGSSPADGRWGTEL